MEIKKLTATTAMAGALGFAAFGLGSGMAQAEPKVPVPNPPIPGDDTWLPGDPPGHNPFGPPGQVKNDLFFNVPPGHWNDPAFVGLPTVWLPTPDLLPDDFPEIEIPTNPLPVVFNPDVRAWGVWVNDNLFVPMPV